MVGFAPVQVFRQPSGTAMGLVVRLPLRRRTKIEPKELNVLVLPCCPKEEITILWGTFAAALKDNNTDIYVGLARGSKSLTNYGILELAPVFVSKGTSTKLMEPFSVCRLGG